MGKAIKYILCFIVVDFFYFSTTFVGMRGINTKEIMAVIGIVLYLTDLRRRRNYAISREFIGLLIYSGLISLAAVFTFVYHNTQDKLYTTYFMSMLTWLSAAYTTVRVIKAVHGKVFIELLSAYVIGVSVTQGLLSVIADMYTPLGDFFVRVIPGLAWSRSVNRLFGFGSMTTLDSAGIRYALVSVLCAHNIRSAIENKNTKYVSWYILAFLIITVTGNMVARTTSVGSLVGLGYMLLFMAPFRAKLDSGLLRTWLWVIIETLAMFLLLALLYNTDPDFHTRLRFAFEGFFSLIETGHWETASNDVLISMYVFPDNIETWLLGDGYFINPYDDPNFLGEFVEGFYMGTDVGYLRFIYFFGLLGLSIYSLYIIFAGRSAARLNPGNDFFFLVLTSMNFIVWLKVATDCFFVLCLFICLGYVKNGMEEQEELEEMEETEVIEE